jgi:hypothetical protein
VEEKTYTVCSCRREQMLPASNPEDEIKRNNPNPKCLHMISRQKCWVLKE